MLFSQFDYSCGVFRLIPSEKQKVTEVIQEQMCTCRDPSKCYLFVSVCVFVQYVSAHLFVFIVGRMNFKQSVRKMNCNTGLTHRTV